MEKTTPKFPASAALHGGLFYDRTLREFDERRHADPDRGTAFEGTVDELPPLDPGILAGQVRLQESSRFRPTEEPVSTALAPQRERKRRVLRAISRQRSFLAQIGRPVQPEAV